ncbi:hypothetical protein B0H15DRAFT_439230 [Mycena belliarum]|uniref:Uncharacterized protein n=1 Tax=Mycena belliarum TaxID=1033014 RepID=A0AAD6XL71_9AGAR|nr:hypothetical protein B0H15DRAFT_439230 [Mycena belliae]
MFEWGLAWTFRSPFRVSLDWLASTLLTGAAFNCGVEIVEPVMRRLFFQDVARIAIRRPDGRFGTAISGDVASTNSHLAPPDVELVSSEVETRRQRRQRRRSPVADSMASSRLYRQSSVGPRRVKNRLESL